MAISRLLLSKAGGPNLSDRRLVQSTKRANFAYYYSSWDSGKSSTSKEDDKESKRESGTWFRALVTNVKQMIMGSPPSQKSIAGKTSDYKDLITASKVTMAQNNPCHTKFPESQSVRISDDTEDAVDKDAFEGAVATATSEDSNIHNNSKNVGLDEVHIRSIQPSEASLVSQGNENDGLKTLAHDEMVENSSFNMGQSGKLPDKFLEELTDKVKQFEGTMSNLHVNDDKKQSLCTEDGVGLDDELINWVRKKLPDNTSGFSSFENTNHLFGRRTATFVQRTSASTNLSKKNTSSCSLRPMDCSEIVRRTKSIPTTGESAEKFHDTLVATQVSTGKSEELSELHRLIKSLRVPPGKKLTSKAEKLLISNVTGQLRTGLLKRVQHQADPLNFDLEKKHTPLKQHFMRGESKVPLDKKEESKVPLDMKEKSRIPAEEVSKENKLLVRFLDKRYTNNNIIAAFSDCGPIVKVDAASSADVNFFRDFLVHFKTRKGYEAALKKRDPPIPRTEAFVEAISLEYMDETTYIPDLIGDPYAPVALVKNPTKTVKIKELTEDISSQQLKEALAFCESGISKLFLGSSSSVAYVEFETEDAKERALAKHSIKVRGKKLTILRIDTPRTTIVRISNIKPHIKVDDICNTYGRVNCVKQRANGVMDVHFCLDEWPNMLNIINGLNGRYEEGSHWLAQPAPIFPPRILKALWSRPEERKYVNAVMSNLFRKLEEPIHTTKGSTRPTSLRSIMARSLY